MKFVSDMGALALGSQLRAVSDRLYDMADATYAQQGSALQSRWFPVLKLLHDKGPQSVGAIAEAVGQTHSAISQLANRLVRDGWLVPAAGGGDRRHRRLALSPMAEKELRNAKPLWRAFAEVLSARSREAGLDASELVAALTRMLDAPLTEEIVARARQLHADAVTIVPFRPELRDHFYRLNADWLGRYFYIEEGDHGVLTNPEDSILKPGGKIFFAQAGEDIVGTCALLPVGEGEIELTKMGVDPASQGLGIGRKLLEHAIAEFERSGEKTLFLETNTRLVPAIRMYESVGFEHQPAPRANSHYQRANVYMVWRPALRDRATSASASG